VHIGQKRVHKTKINIIDYNAETFDEKPVDKVEQCFPFKDRPMVTWINVEGVGDTGIIEKLGQCFGIHPLILEDIVNTNQRPKLEDSGSYLYIVLKMINYKKGENLTVEQVSLILGENFVISFQEGLEGDVFDTIRDYLRQHKGRIREMGADYLIYSMLDAIVDNYFAVIENFENRMELIEEALVADPRPHTLRAIHILKRESIVLRKSVWPLREVINSLERRESPLIKEPTQIYLRDVYDHAIQIIDNIETTRDILSGMTDIYLSSINMRLNEVMKFLTIFMAVFIPITFIASVYGMNFKFMPELYWPWGYYTVLGVMATIAASLMAYFKSKKWW